MTAPDADWARTTAMRKVTQHRAELKSQGRPVTDRKLAEFATSYVGGSASVVLQWMEGE